MLFGIATKVYSTMSGRRAMSDIRNAKANGLLTKMPLVHQHLSLFGRPGADAPAQDPY